MATISLLKNATPQFNNNGVIRSKEYCLDDILLHPDFKNLFSIDNEVLERITKSIQESGFDPTQPLHLWENEGKLYLIDGYTRYSAARKANLLTVPCHLHTEIKNSDEAYQYALRLQINRRNLSQAELLKVISFLSSEYKKEKSSNEAEGGRIVEKIADEIKISPRTVQKYQLVNNEAPEDLKNDVLKGTVSVNQAYNKIKKSKTPPKESKEPLNELIDSRGRLIRVLNEASSLVGDAKTTKEMIDALSFCISIINKELKTIAS